MNETLDTVPIALDVMLDIIGNKSGGSDTPGNHVEELKPDSAMMDDQCWRFRISLIGPLSLSVVMQNAPDGDGCFCDIRMFDERISKPIPLFGGVLPLKLF
jgi:hypothetical protein